MTIVITLIAVVIALALVGAGVIVIKRRSGADPHGSAAAEPARPAIPDPLPMNDLEIALSRVTDSSGRPIRESIDAETGHVDELRVPDDTGPLLRRALDHVANPAADPSADPATDGTPDPAVDATGSTSES